MLIAAKTILTRRVGETEPDGGCASVNTHRINYLLVDLTIIAGCDIIIL